MKMKRRDFLRTTGGIALFNVLPRNLIAGSGAALTAGVSFPLPPRPGLRRNTEKKVPVTAETGIMSAITVSALAA